MVTSLLAHFHVPVPPLVTTVVVVCVLPSVDATIWIVSVPVS